MVGPTSIVGNVPHRVAVVAFDSQPTLLQAFTSNLDTAADTIAGLTPGCTRQHHLENCASPLAIHNLGLGDNGAAILDALGFSVDLLRNQPREYRRAVLLISETLDRGSHIKIEDALRAMGQLTGAASRVTRLTVTLKGREEARYRRGTDTHTDKHEFHSEVLAEATDPAGIERGSGTIRVPASTMHSFGSTNNKIIWTITVKGEINRWPDVDESFDVTVSPA